MQDDPLSRLRDIHLPDAPGFWPPAPGWWMLATLLLVFLALCVRWFVKYRRRQAPRRQAIAELQESFDAYTRGELAAEETIHHANALLKRLWVHVDSDHTVTSLSGAAWLAYLDQRSHTSSFSNGPGEVLGTSRFAPAPPTLDPQLHSLIEALLKSKPPKPSLTPEANGS